MVKKRDSILRINHFSDSESEEDQDNQIGDENHSENDVKMEESSKNEMSESDLDQNQEEPKIKQKIVKPKKVSATKKGKKGIIYISQIPKHMNVTLLREHFEVFGEVGRIYCEPEKKSKGKRIKSINSLKFTPTIPF
jgi:ESF2/ABP1 family protein